jgi:hypothetical protein
MIVSFEIDSKSLYRKLRCTLTYHEAKRRKNFEIKRGEHYKIINLSNLYGVSNSDGLFYEFDELYKLTPDSMVLVIDTDEKIEPVFYKILEPKVGLIWVHRDCLVAYD